MFTELCKRKRHSGAKQRVGGFETKCESFFPAAFDNCDDPCLSKLGALRECVRNPQTILGLTCSTLHTDEQNIIARGMPHFSVSGYRRRSSRYSFGDMPYSRRNAR